MSDVPAPKNSDTGQGEAGSSPWRASSRELRWIKLAAGACLILLTLSLFWPESRDQAPEQQVSAPGNDKHVANKVAPSAPVSEARQAAPMPLPKKIVKKPALAAAKPIAPPAGFYVQIGAFQKREHAKAQLERVESSWSARIAKKPNGMYGVWVGPYATRDKAKETLKQLDRDKLSGFIIKHG